MGHERLCSSNPLRRGGTINLCAGLGYHITCTDTCPTTATKTPTTNGAVPVTYAKAPPL